MVARETVNRRAGELIDGPACRSSMIALQCWGAILKGGVLGSLSRVQLVRAESCSCYAAQFWIYRQSEHLGTFLLSTAISDIGFRLRCYQWQTHLAILKLILDEFACSSSSATASHWSWHHARRPN
jgi:hypothetical protein